MYFPFALKQSTASSKMSSQSVDMKYEMFIPCVQRKYKMDEETKKPALDEKGEHIYDKDRTEREIFWVFKQLNWGFIHEVRVFGFEDKTKKNVTARVSFSSINPKANDLFTQLDAGETAVVNHPRGYWNVVKYSRREPEPQVTFKIKVKTTSPKPASTGRPSTPPSELPVLNSNSTISIIKPNTNKFKILPLEGASSDSEEPK